MSLPNVLEVASLLPPNGAERLTYAKAILVQQGHIRSRLTSILGELFR